MAQIIPQTPTGSVTPEVVRVFNTIRHLPESWRAWFHVAPWEPDAPDFLLLGPEQQALVLKVSRVTPEHARQAPQLRLLDLDQEAPVPAEAEELCLRTFLRAVHREGLGDRLLGAAVVFPNLGPADLRAIAASGVEGQYAWLDKGWINDKGPTAWHDLFPAQPLDAGEIDLLRAQFAPESVVPARFVPRVREQKPSRNRTPGFTDYLLDYEQEAILKSQLDLDVQGLELSRDFRIQLINGVAGSGKTLILLYRLRLLQDLFPRKSYQVLTHNRPLIREMEARYEILHAGGGGDIRWNTFMQWCRRHWPRDRAFNILSNARRDRIIRAIWADHLRTTGISVRMFQGELGWLKDNGIATREAYLDLDRRGRGFRLGPEKREQLFHAIQTYQRRLLALELMDWWDVPRRYWHWVEEGAVSPPRFDVVLVDEAQFFAPVWFNIVREMVQPEVGHLVLAADPTQGFLRRGESWRAIAGLEVRGRAHVLRRSYRTTRKILTMALAFYRQRLPDDTADLVKPELKGMQKGRTPLLLCFDAPQDERQRLVNEIKTAIERGLPPRHVLVLHASGRGAAALVEALNAALGAGAARDPKDAPPDDHVRVTTLNAGTGLESPVVFVAGLHELFELEGSLTLTDDDRADLVEEHTRKLYMAFTRAGQRLILTCTGPIPAPLQALADHDLIEIG